MSAHGHQRLLMGTPPRRPPGTSAKADFRTTELSSWSCRFGSGRPLHRLSPGQRMFLGHDRCPGWHPDRFMPHRVPPQALWQFILIGTALNACIFLFGMSRNGSEISPQRLPVPPEQVMAAIAGWLSAAR